MQLLTTLKICLLVEVATQMQGEEKAFKEVNYWSLPHTSYVKWVITRISPCVVHCNSSNLRRGFYYLCSEHVRNDGKSPAPTGLSQSVTTNATWSNFRREVLKASISSESRFSDKLTNSNHNPLVTKASWAFEMQMELNKESRCEPRSYFRSSPIGTRPSHTCTSS